MGATLFLLSSMMGILLLASSLALVEGNPITIAETISYEDILEFFKNDKLEHFVDGVEEQVEIDALSQKEWGAVINTMTDDRQPSYLLEENFVFRQNHTGSLNSTNGSENHYKNKIYGYLERDGTSGNYSSFSIHYINMTTPFSNQKTCLAVGSVSRFQFSLEGNSSVSWHGASSSSTFFRMPNGSYVYFGQVSSGVSGRAEKDNETIAVYTSSFTVTNTTSNPMKTVSSFNYTLVPKEDNLTLAVGTQDFSIASVDVNTYFILMGSLPKDGEGKFSYSLSGETNSGDSRKLADLSLQLEGHTSFDAAQPFSDDSLPALFNGISLGLVS